MKGPSVLLGLAVCATSRLLPQAPLSTTRLDSTDQLVAAIRAEYDSGFAKLLAALPPTASDTSSDVWPLWALGQFRATRVAWVALQGETYRAIGYGHRMPAYLVVVPPGSPADRRMKGFLQLDPTTSLLVAQMAPVHVSPTWAGLFLLHQLSLLSDLAHPGAPSPQSATEEARSDLQAADLELVAADFLAQGRFRVALDSALAEWRPESPADLAGRVRRAAPSALLPIQASVPSEPARSDAETRLRGGVVATSLLIRYCEQQQLDPDACAALIGQLASPLPNAAPN